MNKQEAIEEIKNIDTLKINDTVSHQQIDMVVKNQVLDIISKIDEPQKVVIPKSVAEWIEENKRIYNLYGLMGRIKDSLAPSEIMKWFSTNPTLTGEILARAWLDGYEVEKEKLYTVEIPNPNIIGNEVYVLMKNVFNQIVMLKKFGVDWKNGRGFQLTESEIKQDFEWAWQFAKEVEG